MQSKRRTHGNLSLKRVTDFPEFQADEVFPTRNPELCRYYDLEVDQECIATACIDWAEPVCVIHLWIPDRYKSRRYIADAVDIFKKIAVPWFKEEGMTIITTNCAVDDLKTKALMQTFGFECQDVTIGLYTG